MQPFFYLVGFIAGILAWLVALADCVWSWLVPWPRRHLLPGRIYFAVSRATIQRLQGKPFDFRTVRIWGYRL